MRDTCPECKGRGEEEYDFPRCDYELGGDWETAWETCRMCHGDGEVDAPPDVVLSRWCSLNKLPNLDAFDLLSRQTLTEEQKVWLTRFIVEREMENED